MGCDIHIFSETFRENQWKCDQQGDPRPDLKDMDDRDYVFFGLMADVRSSAEWNREPKGLPEDVSPELEASYGYEYYHSASYHTREELLEMIQELRQEAAQGLLIPDMEDPYRQQDLMHLIKKLHRLTALLNADVADAEQRVVFWFDN